jgi:hypothetical protein
MTQIIARNVNHAFSDAWFILRAIGLREDSRNGPVLVAPGPVLTAYERPTERVLFNPKRDANPVFHLMEAIWMLAGENNVAWLKQFSANIANYAESDGEIHGAYGHRWRVLFGFDQIARIVGILKKDPNSRQAVLQMWSPADDLFGFWKDRPCNTAAYFDCRGGVLNMTVTCRSNDILWGAYGANAVHFSVLQEVIAAGVGVDVGVYRQFSNNWHAYLQNPQVDYFLSNPPTITYDEYENEAKPFPLVQPWETYEQFIEDCETLVRGGRIFRTEFFKKVAIPLYEAYLFRKAGQPWHPDTIAECDWKMAFLQWDERRKENDQSK